MSMWAVEALSSLQRTEVSLEQKDKETQCLIRQGCSQLQGLNKAFKNIGKSDYTFPLAKKHARNVYDSKLCCSDSSQGQPERKTC